MCHTNSFSFSKKILSQHTLCAKRIMVKKSGLLPFLSVAKLKIFVSTGSGFDGLEGTFQLKFPHPRAWKLLFRDYQISLTVITKCP